MNNLFKIFTTFAVLSLSITGCSTEPAEEPTNTTPAAEITENETTNMEEDDQPEEEQPLTYEENTEEIITTVMNSFEKSAAKQTTDGFMEYREGTNKADSKKYQVLLIETISEPNNFYYFDSRRGFLEVNKFTKGQFQADYVLSYMNFYLNNVSSNVERDFNRLKEFVTFKKESPTGLYIIESEDMFLTPTTATIEIDSEGIIQKIDFKIGNSEERVSFYYGLTQAMQNYINQANESILEEQNLTESEEELLITD